MQIDVHLPAGIFRVNGTVEVPIRTRLTLPHGTVLQRLADKSDSSAKLVHVVCTQVALAGGRIVTEKIIPSASSCWSARAKAPTSASTRPSGRVAIAGSQMRRQAAIWIPNAAACHESGKYTNNFGRMHRVSMLSAETGSLLDIEANTHQFNGVFFSHLFSPAWDLWGAYANQVAGGLLHESRGDFVAIRQHHISSEKYQDSVYNSLFGFGSNFVAAKFGVPHRVPLPSQHAHFTAKCRQYILRLER